MCVLREREGAMSPGEEKERAVRERKGRGRRENSRRRQEVATCDAR